MLNLYEVRKELHKIPEIGYKEFKTHEYIFNILKKYNDLKIHTFDFPGMLVEYSNGVGDYQMFRSDMDALAIKEETNCNFLSEHDGFMHACGHDIHMTVLIGLIEKVIEQKPAKNLLFLFQPAEEGHGGAQRVIKTGILDNYNISEAYSLHVSGSYPVGSIASKSGVIFAIPQEFVAEFSGKSSHIAFPQKGKDAFAAGVSFYQNMQTLMNQKFPATEPVVFYIGKIEAGTVMNAVPASCIMEGTARTLSKTTWQEVNNLIENTAKHTAEMYNLDGNISFVSTYDPVVNSKDLYNRLKDLLPHSVNFIEAETAMTGEDFGFFTTEYNGLLFWLGAGTNIGDLHSNKFLPDEKCIDIGVKVFSCLAGIK